MSPRAPFVSLAGGASSVRADHHPLLWIRCDRWLEAPQFRRCGRILAGGDFVHGDFDEIYPDHASMFEGRGGARLEALISQIEVTDGPRSRPSLRRQISYTSQFPSAAGFNRFEVACKCGAHYKVYLERVQQRFRERLEAGANLDRPVIILTREL